MKVTELLNRAQACCANLPERRVSEKTLISYRATFARMWREPTLDAMRPGIAMDTYYQRRGALHTVGRLTLLWLAANCKGAAERDDVVAFREWGRRLERALDRIEPALALDPPSVSSATAMAQSRSRWRASEGPLPVRGKGSKKHVLGELPHDWTERLWRAAVEYWAAPEDQTDLDALAVCLSAPVRPEEFVAGERGLGRSEGVLVERKSAARLDICIWPAKSHGGRYGTLATIVKINPGEAEEAARYLAHRCAQAGGSLTVRLRSKNASRKKLKLLGSHALSEFEVTITHYVCRHQVVADLKATLGAGVEVAGAAGHCTDRTQSHYGRVEHGRKRRGWIGVEYVRAPAPGNVARARSLARKPRRQAADREVFGGLHK